MDDKILRGFFWFYLILLIGFLGNSVYASEQKEPSEFSNIFGGATATEGTVSWLSNDNELIKEKVTIVYSFAEGLDKKKVNQVVAYATSLKEEM